VSEERDALLAHGVCTVAVEGNLPDAYRNSRVCAAKSTTRRLKWHCATSVASVGV
jgi:hypothetical protein